MSDPIIVDDSHLECTIKECYRIVSADGLDYNGTTTVLQKGSTLSFTFSGTHIAVYCSVKASVLKNFEGSDKPQFQSTYVLDNAPAITFMEPFTDITLHRVLSYQSSTVGTGPHTLVITNIHGHPTIDYIQYIPESGSTPLTSNSSTTNPILSTSSIATFAEATSLPLFPSATFSNSSSSSTATAISTNNIVGSRHMNVGAAVSGAAGGTVLVVGVLTLFFSLRRRRKRWQNSQCDINATIQPYVDGSHTFSTIRHSKSLLEVIPTSLPPSVPTSSSASTTSASAPLEHLSGQDTQGETWLPAHVHEDGGGRIHLEALQDVHPPGDTPPVYRQYS